MAKGKGKKKHFTTKKRDRMSSPEGEIAVPGQDEIYLDENGKELKPAHRPTTDIDWTACEAMLKIGATAEEIAFVFNCDPNTLNRRCKAENGLTFAEWSNKYRSEFNISLRRAQLRSAFGQKSTRVKRKYKGKGEDREVIEEVEEEFWLLYPSVQAQIWLGKQYLGQSDKVEQTNIFGGDEEEDVPWIITSMFDDAEVVDTESDDNNGKTET